MRFLLFAFGLFVLTGCQLSGDGDVEIAPYAVLQSADDQAIELRNYAQMILVSAPMREGDNAAFRKLFAYISGENVDAKDIDMSAPVIIEEGQGQKIPMTAPVFMDTDGAQFPMMSFVMPDSFTPETTPMPIDGDLVVQKIEDYQVAVIRFSGQLSDLNIAKNRNILEQWIIDQGYVVVGPVKVAGYDAPLTLPSARRNEVLIPVEKQ